LNYGKRLKVYPLSQPSYGGNWVTTAV
jgi:hypothetical protein